MLSHVSSQCTSCDDVRPAGESDKQVEPGAGGSGEAFPPSGYTSECLGSDTDREWREGRVAGSLVLLAKFVRDLESR